MKQILIVLALFVGINVSAADSVITEAPQADSYAGELKLDPNASTRAPGYYTFFDWARGYNGWGYCYEFDRYGYVLNGGRPVPNRLCERVHPSYFDWARGVDGHFYCFQFTPYHAVMNDGRSVHPRHCRL